MSAERWASIDGYEGLYEVSDLGRVRALPRIVGKRLHHRKGMVLKPLVGQYARVTLSKNCASVHRNIHKLVIEAFVGKRPMGKQCCHNNGNRYDNRAINLRWDTPLNNQADRREHGTLCRGTGCSQARLTEADVIAIRSAHKDGAASQTALAAKYGVTISTVHQIVKRKTWKHI